MDKVPFQRINSIVKNLQQNLQEQVRSALVDDLVKKAVDDFAMETRQQIKDRVEALNIAIVHSYFSHSDLSTIINIKVEDIYVPKDSKT